jgi:hypothetical protein
MTAIRTVAALASSFVLGGTSCLPPPITVYNQTDATYYVYETCVDFLPAAPGLELFSTWVQDGTFVGELGRDTLVHAPEYRLDPFDSAELGYEVRESEGGLYCDDGRARYFFIPEETMRTRSWDEIVRGQLYEGRVIVSVEELEATDWRVFYDG